MGFASFIIAIIFFVMLTTAEEGPRKYKVPSPKVPEQKREVEETRVKVRLIRDPHMARPLNQRRLTLL
jgi:hypothetical protein